MGKTRGVHETTPELRNRMVGMYEAGLGLREIAAAVNCSQRTVKRWLNRFDKEGTVETRDRCGRKRATTTEQDEAIVKLATQTPITAAKVVLPALGLSCSVDTIRERLHKAGIHNWSPCRKHIQRIPLGNADGAAIQQAVWRPTGTQLGKKKSQKSDNKSKKSTTTTTKKRKPAVRNKPKDSYVGDGAPAESSKSQEGIVNPPSTFVFPAADIPQPSSLPPLPAPHSIPQSTDLTAPPPPPPPSLLANNTPEFSNNMSLVLPTHSIYPQHPPVSQNWPIDLVSNHHYPQNPTNPMTHEEPPAQQHLQELHTHREQQQAAEQQSIQSIHQQTLLESPSVSHNSTGIQRNTRIRSISSNSSSSTDNPSDGDNDIDKEGSKDNDTSTQKSKRLKKKGGKAKGTLETSVEIRNRMIGMSEAGLSTLSIALAINRSERTVKRWLERWNKEGNVQTKERKGRRRITTKEQDDAIIAMATQHPLTAAKHVAPALGLNCSVDTIRERLHKAGIHSWKLGKKQGEGNAVHTVHLWQPSGNRPNKPKVSGEKKKKSGGLTKKSPSTGANKRTARRKKTAPSDDTAKNMEVSQNLLPEQPPIQYHDTGPLNTYPTAPNLMGPVHIAGAGLVPGPPGPQPIHSLGPLIQQRPDCRLAPPLPVPGSSSTGYSSCMVGNSGHMDQNDPLNYEQFMWTF